MNIRNVIFDLDGTLVDSRSGIEFSMRAAIEAILPDRKNEPFECRPGPPIREAFARLFGDAEETSLDELVGEFRKSYDSAGWTQTRVYDGAADALRRLRDDGTRLFVATNKPERAALAILERLGLRGFFDAVVAPDSRTPPFGSKQRMVAWILDAHDLDANETIVVGDSEEDRIAAEASGVAFAAAGYGYGNPDLRTTRTRRIAVVPCLTELCDVLSGVV